MENKTKHFNMNPIISNLFEIDYNNSEINDKIKELTFKYILKRDKLKLYIDIFKETDIEKLINLLKDVENIEIKQYDENGEIINIFSIKTTSDTIYDYQIQQDWNDHCKCLSIAFIFKGITTIFKNKINV